MANDVEAVAAEVVDEKNVIKLSKPLPNGADELVFDFDKISGIQLIDCEKKAKKQDPTIMVPSLSMIYQAMVAAKATGVKYDDIIGLKGPDFTAACMRAQNFLLQ